MILQKLRELAAVKKKTFHCLLASLVLALVCGIGCGHKAPPRPIDAPVKKKKGLSGSAKSDKKDTSDASTKPGDVNGDKNNTDTLNGNSKTQNGDRAKTTDPYQ